jgi:hypothetical protein
MGWGSAMVAAFLAVLGRPSTWVIALAGFFARGGLLLVVLPIIVMPTTSGFANLVGPTLIPFVFGQPSPSFYLLLGASAAAVLGWLIVAGLLGAWTDATLIRDAAEEEDLGFGRALPARRGLVWRSVVARFLAHIPFTLALSWGAIRIVEAGYRELVLPEDLATPLVVRVMLSVPYAFVVVLATWMAGEAFGGLVQRRLALEPVSVGRALVQALGHVVRRPLSSLMTLVVANVVVLPAVLLPALVAGVLWDRLRIALALGDAFGVGIMLVAFVAAWMIGLLLAGVTTAWRGYAWTFEAYRHVASMDPRRDTIGTITGTIGRGGPARPGEWPTADPSGSL